MRNIVLSRLFAHTRHEMHKPCIEPKKVFTTSLALFGGVVERLGIMHGGGYAKYKIVLII